MPISDAAIEKVMTNLGDKVGDDVDYCFQEWDFAVSEAIEHLPEPEDDSAFLEWIIAFIGNMAWAATVFFPPAAALKAGASSVSAATKAVSVLGAAVGGGGPTKLIDYINNNTDDDHPVPPPLNSKKGQAFLIDYTAERSNATRTIYMTLAPKFIDEFLLNQLIAAASVKFESALDDTQFVNFVGSVDGHEIRRTSVWEDFVFPNYNCTRDKGRNGLYHFILEQLTKAIKQFDLQYKQYSARLDKYEKEQSRYKWAKHTRSGRKESKPTPPGQFVPDIDFGLPLDQNSLFKITFPHIMQKWFSI